MAFVSLRQAFDFLPHEDKWKSQRRFQQLVACWPEIVGAVVAAQTRPYAIQRQTLQVGTSSPVWAQTLVFERLRILEKLNARMNLKLTDIRFSTVYWHAHSDRPIPSQTSQLWQEHPSRVEPLKPPVVASPHDAGQAFQHWSQTIQAQTQHLPLCPRCHCPTPEGELRRWSICGHCISQS